MTDERRRNATLSGPQEAALAALLAGSTVTEAAERATVARPTVSDWLHHDRDFRAELRSRRAELWDALRRKLETAGVKAVDALAGALGDEDPRVRLAAAGRILTLLGGELAQEQTAAENNEHLTALARSIELRMRAAPAEYGLPRDADEEGAA